MDERLKFIARLLDGEQMAGLCRAFGISRKTGYKIVNRYNNCGLAGLTDRSRRPYRQANQLPLQIETLIVRLKHDKPSWGAPKIKERLARPYSDVHAPAISTVHAVLDRHGLVQRRTRRRNRAKGTPLSCPGQPNDLWCADYKGEFMLADRRYCYPLTITDFASRYLIACEALATTKEAYAFTVFENAFKEFGLPRAIRTDNGVEEYWATPLMTFERRAGDCEDYAIAKPVALQEMGFEARDLRIVVVRDENGQGHAMTAARQDDRWLILDNRQFGLADDKVTDRSIPLFVIDDDGAKRLLAPRATGPKKEAAPDTAAASALLVWPAAVAAPFPSLMPG
jgi:putative transposase